MPSTYSPSLRLELIGNGEQAGTWGTTTNNNLGTLLEAAITGVQPITLTGGDYTLTDFNGLPDESRNAVLVLGGLLAAPCNVIAPASEKVYIVRNFSNATVTIKTASGNGVALTNAASAVVFCDGTDFYSATTLNYIDGNLTVTGTTQLQGAVTANSTLSVGGSVTLSSDVYGNSNTGQWYLPSGNTSSRNNSAPVNGLIRYNSTGNFFEGYANSTWVKFVVQNQAGYTIDYLVVAGGGGGGIGQGGGGGGGAGQLVSSSTFVIQGSTVWTITVGAGGAAQASGSGSSITGVASASTGGSAGSNAPDQNFGGAGGASGNGYAGGNGAAAGGGGGNAGGGGGSEAVGGSANSSAAGNGGVGTNTTIRGVSEYFSGGGGGAGATPGSGGLGGGGNGASGSAPTPGTINTGGGGGGGNNAGTAAGGSGVVILKFETAYYSGVITGSPTVTTSGSNTILTFTGSGTYQL